MIIEEVSSARDNSVVEFSIVAVLMLSKTRVVAGSIPAREKYIIIMLYILIYTVLYLLKIDSKQVLTN